MRIDISIERHFPSGGWNISAFKGNTLVRMHYQGYTKKEAISLFKQHYKEFK